MSENPTGPRDPDEYDDQDSEPGSQPSGAAAAETDPDDDQDAGPASQPDD